MPVGTVYSGMLGQKSTPDDPVLVFSCIKPAETKHAKIFQEFEHIAPNVKPEGEP